MYSERVYNIRLEAPRLVITETAGVDSSGNHYARAWFYGPEGYARVTSVGHFSKDGLAKVSRNHNENNYITKTGRILLDKWYYIVQEFKDGFAMISKRTDEKNTRTNFVDCDGNMLSREWFAMAFNFSCGVARVQRTSDFRWNHMKPDGTYVSDMWWDSAEDFIDDMAIIHPPLGYNYINLNGKVISDIYFEHAGPFKDGYAIVRRYEDEFNIIRKDGSLVSSNMWFKAVFRSESRPEMFDVIIKDTIEGRTQLSINGSGRLYTRGGKPLPEIYQCNTKDFRNEKIIGHDSKSYID